MSEQNLVSGLAEWLMERGFSVTEERQVGGFENILLRFVGEGCEVHLIRERGRWGITLTPPAGEPKLPPQIWRYYMDDIPLEVALAEQAESFESEVAFVRNRLHEITAVAQSDENIGDRLVDINWAIVKDRLGLDPGMPRPGQP
ncbi:MULTISPECIES: hypothetical protein [unclassified Streptomyces]|uniref:hypothetical protein n=1 Tax=unclassified Streptomyces TaxID=2593676 RepID=UPI002365E551|nr:MULTISPECIES: hypothetical protein [unclassified Streptomyces]MDF3143015.1 hypothetical protein [Streptomyces sp. T21Q-yed]WDF38544.1 hypothetical protein PBV52_17955 [Streptomyces sp. T12]